MLLVPAPAGHYSCFTYTINLAAVCDPDTSYYLPGSGGLAGAGGCVCYDPTRACPPKDLTKEPALFFSLRVSQSHRGAGREMAGITME
jgi:hypothetical protein